MESQNVCGAKVPIIIFGLRAKHTKYVIYLHVRTIIALASYNPIWTQLVIFTLWSRLKVKDCCKSTKLFRYGRLVGTISSDPPPLCEWQMSYPMIAIYLQFNVSSHQSKQLPLSSDTHDFLAIFVLAFFLSEGSKRSSNDTRYSAGLFYTHFDVSLQRISPSLHVDAMV